MIDRLMKRRGYIKTREDRYSVYYEKREPPNIVKTIGVLKLVSGEIVFQSYDAKVVRLVNGEYINQIFGVEIPVLFLMWMKAHYMKIKNHW